MNVEIDFEVLQKVFDTAVHSMDFGSGFLDHEEVDALRACAVLLGVDPSVATPSNFKCQYDGGSCEWISIGSPGNPGPPTGPAEEACRLCRAVRQVPQTGAS